MKPPFAVWVLGDQLSLSNPALQRIPPESRAQIPVVMVEAVAESKVVWVHKARIAIFLSAMRHFAQTLRAQGYTVIYSTLADTGSSSLVEKGLQLAQAQGATTVVMAEPGEWRLEQDLVAQAKAANVGLQLLEDTHFMCSRAQFARWSQSYKQLRMEFFYREMRKQHAVLMQGDQPEGGQWNFDAENRSAYPKAGPGQVPQPLWFRPDNLTQEVLAEVQTRFADHPGSLESFAWPVTREQALQALQYFLEHRLVNFGQYQDAMWTNTPYGWHSLVSACINLHLLDPREVIQAAEQAYRQGRADLASVEGFIRQILGWREFIRGVYWLDMPKMRQDNFLNATQDLPDWFWTGNTHMACLKDSLGQTLQHGYAHHIQRLMVIGNFALLAGLSPQQVEDWFLAVYVDAVEWVELPNVAGMALFANGGRFTSKPYVASGAYINRMSNYCSQCKYKPAEKLGERACPFTTLYWDFIDRHLPLLQGNPRTALMAKNLTKMTDEQRQAIRDQAQQQLSGLNGL